MIEALEVIAVIQEIQEGEMVGILHVVVQDIHKAVALQDLIVGEMI